MNTLEALSQRVSDEISHGKELHADEQAPAFLYSEVSNLEKIWDDTLAKTNEKHKQLKVWKLFLFYLWLFIIIKVYKKV